MQSYFLVTCKMCNYIKQTTKDSFSSSGLGVMFIIKTTQDSKIKDIWKILVILPSLGCDWNHPHHHHLHLGGSPHIQIEVHL